MEEIEANVARAQQARARWANVAAVPQASEAADTPAEAAAKWQQIYRLFNATSEGTQDEVFAAVNMYFLVNGTSPECAYKKPIRTAGGVEVSAGDVTKITGTAKGEVRQFMRGRLKDSYEFLKNNPAVVHSETVVAKAQNAAIPKYQAWLLADWLGENCPYFIGDEATVYRKYRASVIAVSAARRRTAPKDRDNVIADSPEVRGLPSVDEPGHGYNTTLY